MNMIKKILIVLFATNVFALCGCCIDNYTQLKQDIFAFYNANKLQEAYLLIAQIPEEKRDADLWLLLANISQDYDKNIDAIFLLQKAISVNPKYYKAYYNLGNLYLDDGNITKAMNNYNLAIKYNREFAYSFYNRGICYLMAKKYWRAKRDFLQAIKLKPTEPIFYYNLALVYKKMKNEKMANKAIKSYNTLSES